MRLVGSCSNISMETIFMNMEKIKLNEPHKFLLKLSEIT